MRQRRTVRVLLVDPAGRILLMKGRLPSNPTAPGVWFTLGGGIEPGETLAQAATREIGEETGFADVEIGAILGEGEQTHHDRKGRPVGILETYLLARCAGAEPSRAGWNALEREFVDDIRWWTLAELTACTEPVFPPDLASIVERVLSSYPSPLAGEGVGDADG